MIEKISIITIVKNSEKTILKTIESVYSQINLIHEYLIIDGGSTDSTISKITHSIFLKSEKIKFYSIIDDGIYEGINNGISLVTGDYILLVHSNDILLNGTVDYYLKNIDPFENYDVYYSNSLSLFSKCRGVSSSIKLRQLTSCSEDKLKRTNHMSLIHSSMLIKTNVLLNQMYDTSFRIAGDYDLLLKFLNSKKKFKKLNFNSHLLYDIGLTTENKFLALSEVHIANKLNGRNSLASIIWVIMELIKLFLKRTKCILTSILLGEKYV